MVGLIIILILVGAGVYFYKSSPMSDPSAVKQRYKNRSEEQKKVIRYFTVEGCLSKTISDEEYDSIKDAVIQRKDFKQDALDKIGLDESELQEIEPVTFHGWVFGESNVFAAKYGKDGVPRSSAYQVTWLFFSASQVYLYRNTIHFDKDDKSIITEEYFYKDITNFSTSSDTVETPFWDPKQEKTVLKNVDSNRFALTVPGDKFFCSLEQNDYTNRAIQAMKAKLREKKS
jgi:hypothetical protein